MLYQFWSHYLVEHFEWEIFQEFREQAVADLGREPSSIIGLKHFVALYETVLNKSSDTFPLDDSAQLLEDAKRLLGEAAHGS